MILTFLSSIADTILDTQKQKQSHRFLIYTGSAMSVGGVVWGTITFSEGLAWQSIIPYSYAAITILNFLYLYITKNFKVAQTIQGAISLFIPFLFQISLGGFIASGAVIIWSMLSVLVSFTFQEKRRVFLCFGVYISLIIISGLIDNNIRFLAHNIPINDSILFFTLNITMISISIFILFLYFIISKEKLEIEIYTIAYTDSLTNLPNRRNFFIKANKEFVRAKEEKDIFSLFLLDIDFFKLFNDTYGHDTGDKVLVDFAKLLQDITREVDIICRYGGEEFIVLMPKIKIDKSIIVAQRIIDACKNMIISVQEHKLNVTVSIGVTKLQLTDISIEDTIKRADSFLYEAKQNGRNQFQVSR